MHIFGDDSEAQSVQLIHLAVKGAIKVSRGQDVLWESSYSFDPKSNNKPQWGQPHITIGTISMPLDKALQKEQADPSFIQLVKESETLGPIIHFGDGADNLNSFVENFCAGTKLKYTDNTESFESTVTDTSVDFSTR
jgi:hypothetical protein